MWRCPLGVAAVADVVEDLTRLDARTDGDAGGRRTAEAVIGAGCVVVEVDVVAAPSVEVLDDDVPSGPLTDGDADNRSRSDGEDGRSLCSEEVVALVSASLGSRRTP